MKTFEHDDTLRFNQWVSTDRSQLVEQESAFDDFVDDLVEKFLRLTEHYCIPKQQSEFFKETKANLKFGECAIVLDFAENYSFLVQDAAQGFHWNNSQATIHHFVIYYSIVAGDIMHKSNACASDHKTHDTVTVHSFLKHFYEHHISKEFPFLEKVFYLSDGSAFQYKNFKSLINFLFHLEDFKFQAEWNFFATSLG